jgi:hypothetical protein
LPLAILLALETLRLWSGAASDCRVFDAGARYGVTFFAWPVLSLGLWTAFGLALFVLRKHVVGLGFLVGLIVALAICYWFAAGTADMIRASGEIDREVCPNGVPPWWPPWLPQ